MTQNNELALDTDTLDKARAMHRVWRALNDGDCPKCHRHVAATRIRRDHDCRFEIPPKVMTGCIQCPNCGFGVTGDEIDAIEKQFAPAMDRAVAVFEEWRSDREVEE